MKKESWEDEMPSNIEEETKELLLTPNIFPIKKHEIFPSDLIYTNEGRISEVLFAGGINQLNAKQLRVKSPATAPSTRCLGDTAIDDIPILFGREELSFKDISTTIFAQTLINESRFHYDLFILKKFGLKMGFNINIPKVANLSGSHRVIIPGTDAEEHKKVLILDLDNTLVLNQMFTNKGAHRDLYSGFAHNAIKGTIHYTKEKEFSFLLRPFSVDFLHKMKKLYYLVVFTAAETKYARRVLEKIEVIAGEKLFDFFYSRSHLGHLGNGFPVKRLIAGVEESEIVVVDDSFMYWFHCPRNFIPVKPFIGEIKDKTLITLANYLEVLANTQDVRELNDQYLGVSQKMTIGLGLQKNRGMSQNN